MASGYQVKQVMLQRAAAGVPQVSRISSPHPCLACGRQPDGCRAGSNGLSQARLTHRGAPGAKDLTLQLLKHRGGWQGRGKQTQHGVEWHRLPSRPAAGTRVLPP